MQGLGMVHDIISPQNLSQFSVTMTWQYWLGKIKSKVPSNQPETFP